MNEISPILGIELLSGTLIGSFLNVCIYRIPRDLSVVVPRSFCPHCGATLGWYDNVPVISYVLLRGRCRHCAHPIGWRYPAVEMVTGIVFALVLTRYGLTAASSKWLIFESLMVVLFCTDVEERLLPDEFTVGGLAFALLASLFVPVHSALFEAFFSLGSFPRIASVLIAAGSAFVLAFLFWATAKVYERFRSPDALGLGDVKLLALLGAFLGFDGGVAAAMIGSVSGALLGVVYAAVTKQDWRTATLPFGSFLCAGGAIVALLPK